MKAELLNDKNKNWFRPFDIKLTVENEKEARLLYHVFNDESLRIHLKKSDYGEGFEMDSELVVNQFKSGSLEVCIEEELESQGYDLD